MKRKSLRILIPVLVLVLAAGIRLLQQLQKTEPIYFRTAAFGRWTANLKEEPFTVYCWTGGDRYTPVFRTEEEVAPIASAISGSTLYYAAWSGENGSLVCRVDLQTGQKDRLADLDFQVRELAPCGEVLLLTAFRERGYCLGVLREGEFLDCASLLPLISNSPLSCDGSGCWYVSYDSETAMTSLCHLPADTLVPETVYRNIPFPHELQAAPEGVYCACQFTEDVEAGFYSLMFYPRDGSGAVKLLTELEPDGPAATAKTKVGFTGCMAVWGDDLFYVTYSQYAPRGESWLHALDRKTGRITDYGRIRDVETGPGIVRFPYLLNGGKQGFLLTESNWWAADPEEANVYSFYTWTGRCTQLRPAEEEMP